MYDMSKLKIFDRDPAKYHQERARVTSESERIRPMFSNGEFNSHTFNKVFEHHKKSDTVTANGVPTAMLSTKMPAYGYAMDGGQTMLRSDRERLNGASQLDQAYNSHVNPDDYSESLIEKCKSRSYTAKEKAMSQSEIQGRLSQRGVNFNIPAGAKPDFSRPVENNSMIHEEEAPAPPLILTGDMPPPRSMLKIPAQSQFQPQQQQPFQPQQQQPFQPQQQQFQPQQQQPFPQFKTQTQTQTQPQSDLFQFGAQPQQQFLQGTGQALPQFFQQPPLQANVVHTVPLSQLPPPPQPKQHKHKRPPIYNRSSLSGKHESSSNTNSHSSGGVESELSELKKLVRKQEEQISLLLSTVRK